MKVLVTGASGQVGYDVVRELTRRGHDVLAPSRQELDLLHPDGIQPYILAKQPEAIIHCAAWTAVDDAEDKANRSLVETINVLATRALAEACHELDSKLIYLSTDYVFDGLGQRPWTADDDAYEPLNVYGKSKLDGEEIIRQILAKYYIVRISWVFGSHGQNFVKTMLRLAENHRQLTIVDDQIGRPTYTRDLARLLVDMVETDSYGTYHACNEGPQISWCQFAQEIFRQARKQVEVVPVTTAQYGISKAVRPLNSRLDTSKLVEEGFTPLPIWTDALNRYLQEIGITK